MPRATLSLVEAPPGGPTVIAAYDGFDASGNTSIAHETANAFKWSGSSPYDHGDWGYFTPSGEEVPYVKRDRDLGQTFSYTGPSAARLTAITVRTGFGTNAVRLHAYGQPVSLQVFRVTGAPAVHDNGTSGSVRALHGFPHDRHGQHIPAERDDYVVGETYESIAVFRGARFPSRTDFGLDGGSNADPDHQALKGRFLRFDLSGVSGVILTPGNTYAFLVMLDEAGHDRGFTLANHYVGSFVGGHAIRRDGNGTFPPAAADPSRPFTHATNAPAMASAHFPRDFDERIRIAPGTNGYPDVDTWRDLCFWVEVGAR